MDGTAANIWTFPQPTVSEAKLRGEFAADFTVDRLREFRLDAVDMQPLGWSCLMTRRR